MPEHFYDRTIKLLESRGVTKRDFVDLVIFLQKDYIKTLTPEMIYESLDLVLRKREVQNAIMTGIQLDLLAEEKKLFSPLQEIIEKDEGLYGIDEVMSFSITNLYGSIGFTNYGYIDKVKPGILAILNDKSTGKVNTFLDDIVGAIAAATASRLAHKNPKLEDDNIYSN
ncbi:phosphatidylglycerophosphatase A [Amylolactobacillus amylotrophicus DSM 20534]|uniref:Phosphatidylglycerophosphatase A n=3 Tax=Amylolactobacillus TaxID=2767876 RepID=A0A0R1YIQ6_9LACO|nr:MULTISPECIES: phosphatidylglycerophosphatase A [Amylolactobacillus]APT18043.1 phosphatidylglycerophosphatase A [Amylolactobacillus amylophilus DSM 20533 = JCM 1125]KRK37385.1 phosphatidylglycerophosphatase A [Amylolactobacillus amylotrophicus DSM 20534]KRM42058.1 phosphatidylglycerophosphatase A [Amylolactobacillus amylophilus DSM 20533 = JCM 1125]GED80601.1 phosphatidylglycerophosphatase A [Amylolactobacillus amylophilus]